MVLHKQQKRLPDKSRGMLDTQTAVAQVLVTLCVRLGLARPREDSDHILCAGQSVLRRIMLCRQGHQPPADLITGLIPLLGKKQTQTTLMVQNRYMGHMFFSVVHVEGSSNRSSSSRGCCFPSQWSAQPMLRIQQIACLEIEPEPLQRGYPQSQPFTE